jgi:hypothetical protein
MRFSLVMILILIISVMMGMNSHAAKDPLKAFEDCSPKGAFDKGFDDLEEPQSCRIGEVSVVHEYWLKGKEERLKKQASSKSDESRTPSTSN